jgi:hypothetical protein
MGPRFFSPRHRPTPPEASQLIFTWILVVAMFSRQQKLFLLTILLLGAAVKAADFEFTHAATGFLGWKAASGVSLAKAAYKSCVEKEERWLHD